MKISCQKINSIRIMHFSVQRYYIMTGYSIFCNINRFSISLIKKFRSPVQTFRCHRPANGSPWKSFISFYFFRFSVFPHTDTPSVINILPIYINRLCNQFHILFCNFRKIFFITFQSFFRIMSQQYRI